MHRGCGIQKKHLTYLKYLCCLNYTITKGKSFLTGGGEGKTIYNEEEDIKGHRGMKNMACGEKQ